MSEIDKNYQKIAKRMHKEFVRRKIKNAESVKECLDAFWDAYNVRFLHLAAMALKKAIEFDNQHQKVVDIKSDKYLIIIFALYGVKINT